MKNKYLRSVVIDANRSNASVFTAAPILTGRLQVLSACRKLIPMSVRIGEPVGGGQETSRNSSFGSTHGSTQSGSDAIGPVSFSGGAYFPSTNRLTNIRGAPPASTRP